MSALYLIAVAAWAVVALATAQLVMRVRDRRRERALFLSHEEAVFDLPSREAALVETGFSPRERERLLRRVYGGDALKRLRATAALSSDAVADRAGPADPSAGRETGDE